MEKVILLTTNMLQHLTCVNTGRLLELEYEHKRQQQEYTINVSALCTSFPTQVTQRGLCQDYRIHCTGGKTIPRLQNELRNCHTPHCPRPTAVEDLNQHRNWHASYKFSNFKHSNIINSTLQAVSELQKMLTHFQSEG